MMWFRTGLWTGHTEDDTIDTTETTRHDSNSGINLGCVSQYFYSIIAYNIVYGVIVYYIL